MATTYFSPVGNTPWMDSNGVPLVGGYWNFFLAGTTTPVATYTDNTGNTSQPTDITLQSDGLPANPIWLSAGIPVKARLYTSGGVLLETYDYITGVNDPTFTNTISQWISFTGTLTYISATSFSVAGDQTNTFQVNLPIRTTNTGGTIYSTITASSYSSGSNTTTVTVVNVTGSLDSGLSALSYGIITPTNPAIPPSLLLSAWRNKADNGGMLVARRLTAPNLSTTAQVGQVDRFMCWASTGSVSAGTITQNTSATIGRTGRSLRIAGATLTGSAVLSIRQRLRSERALQLKNQTAVFQCQVLHDVGSTINYTVVIRKPTALNNFASTTTILTSAAKAVPTATGTAVNIPATALGDVSFGLEIELQISCGAVTTKNFDVTEWQIEASPAITPFEDKPYGLEELEASRFLPVFTSQSTEDQFAMGQATSTTTAQIYLVFETFTYTKPSAIVTVGFFQLVDAGGGGLQPVNSITMSVASTRLAVVIFVVGSGLVAGNATGLQSITNNGQVIFTGAEI